MIETLAAPVVAGVVLGSFVLTTGLLLFQTPFPEAYAIGYKFRVDYSEYLTRGGLIQESIGSGESTDLNCSGQEITGNMAMDCITHEDENGGDGDGEFIIQVVANEGMIECEPPLPPGDSFIAAVAVSDRTLTGNYTITHISTVTQQRTGEISAAFTDGITYTISAENLGFCSDSASEIRISGDCGDDVIIRYEDDSATGTFTGDVECRLIA